MEKMTQDALLSAAKRLSDLMYSWNVVDVHELVVDDPRNGGSVYHHVDQALTKALELLGTRDKQGFYDMVTSGVTPVEALERAKAADADLAETSAMFNMVMEGR